MVYQFKSDEDFIMATRTLIVALPFIVVETEKVLKSRGWTIVKRGIQEGTDGIVCPVLELERGDYKPVMFLRNAIDEVVFEDRDAELKVANIYGSRAEIYEKAQRVILDKIATLELSYEYCEKGIKEDLATWMQARMPSTSHVVRAETYDKKGEKENGQV